MECWKGTVNEKSLGMAVVRGMSEGRGQSSIEDSEARAKELVLNWKVELLLGSDEP